MLKIGLTGGIASGKTAVANEFSRLGASIIDADAIAREIVRPGTPALENIITHFGSELLTSLQELNRPLLRQIIFADEDEKRWLEQLLHPLIRESIEAKLSQVTATYHLLVSPLLFETNQNKLVNRVLVVDAPVPQQFERALRRDNSDRQTIESIIKAQMPRDQRLAQADDILDNSGDFATTCHHIFNLHQQYLALSHDS